MPLLTSRRPKPPPSVPPSIEPVYCELSYPPTLQELSMYEGHYIYIWFSNGCSAWVYVEAVRGFQLCGHVWSKGKWTYGCFSYTFIDRIY